MEIMGLLWTDGLLVLLLGKSVCPTFLQKLMGGKFLGMWLEEIREFNSNNPTFIVTS